MKSNIPLLGHSLVRLSHRYMAVWLRAEVETLVNFGRLRRDFSPFSLFPFSESVLYQLPCHWNSQTSTEFKTTNEALTFTYTLRLRPFSLISNQFPVQSSEHVSLVVVPRNMLRKHFHVGVGGAEIKNTSKTILATKKEEFCCLIPCKCHDGMHTFVYLFTLKNRLSKFLGCRNFFAFPLKLWELTYISLQWCKLC